MPIQPTPYPAWGTGYIRVDGKDIRANTAYMWGHILAATDIRISSEFDSPSSTTAGILEAVNDLPVEGGVIYVPPGTYIPSTKIVVARNNVKIFGAGEATIIYAAAGLNDNVIELGDGAAAYTDLEVSNLTINGNKAGQTAGSGLVINTRVSRARFRDLRITNCYKHGFQSYSTSAAEKNNGIIMEDTFIDLCNLLQYNISPFDDEVNLKQARVNGTYRIGERWGKRNTTLNFGSGGFVENQKSVDPGYEPIWIDNQEISLDLTRIYSYQPVANTWSREEYGGRTVYHRLCGGGAADKGDFLILDSFPQGDFDVEFEMNLVAANGIANYAVGGFFFAYSDYTHFCKIKATYDHRGAPADEIASSYVDGGAEVHCRGLADPRTLDTIIKFRLIRRGDVITIYRDGLYFTIMHYKGAAIGAALGKIGFFGYYAHVHISNIRIYPVYDDVDYLDRPVVVLGFDDGASNSDTYFNTCKPYMDARGMVGTFFMTSGHVGAARQVTWDQLREMQADGWEIANHTKTHTNLGDAALTGAQIYDAVYGAKVDFEAQNLKIWTFAYPVGAYIERAVAAVRATHFAARSSDFLTGAKGPEDPNRYLFEGVSFAIAAWTNATVDSFIYAVQSTAKRWAFVVIDDSVEAGHIGISVFQYLIDQLIAEGCEVITFYELAQRLYKYRPDRMAVDVAKGRNRERWLYKRLEKLRMVEDVLDILPADDDYILVSTGYDVAAHAPTQDTDVPRALTVTLSNNSGGALLSTACVLTVAGTLADGTSKSELIELPSTNVPAGDSFTVTGKYPFAKVTSVKFDVAQATGNANWDFWVGTSDKIGLPNAFSVVSDVYKVTKNSQDIVVPTVWPQYSTVDLSVVFPGDRFRIWYRGVHLD